MQRWRIGGVDVTLCSLSQELVYLGLLEGLPTREMNAEHLDELRERHPDAHLVTPEETPIETPSRYSFGTPASLPDVQCIARFAGPGRTDRYLYRTELTVIWFQPSWALPISDAVAATLAGLDWMALASEHEI